MKTKKIIIVFFLILITLNYIVLADNEELTIYSPSAILIDANTGKVLFEKNAYEKMYPASITKVMTAILVLESCDISETAYVSYDAVMTIPSRLCYCQFASWRRTIC